MGLIRHSFSVARGDVPDTLTWLAAYVQPANAEILAFTDIPASKSYQILIDGQPTVKEQNLLVSESDPTETYLVVGGKRPNPRLKHVSVIARAVRFLITTGYRIEIPQSRRASVSRC